MLTAGHGYRHGYVIATIVGKTHELWRGVHHDIKVSRSDPSTCEHS